MKSKLLVLGLVIITLFVIPIYAKYQQPKEYTVTLSIQDWNTAVYSITNPKDVAENPKEALVKKIVDQLNKQLSDTTKPKK